MTFEPQVHNTGEPGSDRFEVWVRGICVARSDHECYLNVYVDGKLVYALQAELDYQDPATLSYDKRPEPVGFTVKAKASTVHGTDEQDLGERTWKLRKDVEE